MGAARAVGETARRFDLYDLFTVIIPGAGLLIGLAPFAPRQSPLLEVGILVPALVVSYIAGRMIHAIAVRAEDFFELMTHRDVFVEELRSVNRIDAASRNQFLRQWEDIADLRLLDGSEIADDVDEKTLSSLYVQTRSLTHIDGRSRSRSLQAIYAFYRSMIVIAAIWALIYLIYGLLFATGAVSVVFPYTTYLQAADVGPAIIIYSCWAGSALLFIVFRDARENYREYYIEYLIYDFLTLERLSSSSSGFQ